MERSDRSTPVRPSPLSWACRLALAGAWLTAWAPASEAQATSLSPRYRFKMMLGGPGYTGGGGACTVIDDLGRIATDVSNGGLVSLVRTDGTTTELIADTSGPIASFENTHAYMQMNSSGMVAFCANMDAGEQAIFTWDGATLVEAVDPATLPWTTTAPPQPHYHFSDLSINASGEAAFVATRWQNNFGSESAIFLYDGASTWMVAQNYFTSSSDWFQAYNLRLLDDSSIAAAAQGSMFPQTQFCYPGMNMTIVRLSPFGSILEALASSLSEDMMVEGSFVWSANTSGEVIYRGGCSPYAQTLVGASSSGQFVIAGTEPPGAWSDFGGASISNSGRIAFWGRTGGGVQGVVADGPDPVRNRVLGTGDVIFGRTVNNLELRFRDAINEAGQICIYVDFTDGTDAMVRADPRPLRRP